MSTTDETFTPAPGSPDGTAPPGRPPGLARWVTGLFEQIFARNDEVRDTEVADAKEARQHRQVAERHLAACEDVQRAGRDARISVQKRHDPRGIHRIPRWVAFWGAGAFAVLDFLPSYYAAQSFGLDQMNTDAVAVLILVALAGAMVVLERATEHGWERALVWGAVASGFGLLFALRFVYLVTMGSSPWGALLAAVALTACSALLVVFGTMLLHGRMHKEVTRAEARERTAVAGTARARRDLGEARVVEQRTYGGLFHRILTASFTGRPAGYDSETITTAIHAELDRLLDLRRGSSHTPRRPRRPRSTRCST